MRAQLRIELKNRHGDTLAVRQAHNAVMRSGAQLIAGLFSGKGRPITHMAVGTSDAPTGDDFDVAALANDASGDLAPLAGPTEAAIPPEAFTITLDTDHHLVRVRVRGTLPPDAAVGTLREAGLISRDGDTTVLYNRVLFAPIVKGDDHELTMFWEVTFPYGDLQWM